MIERYLKLAIHYDYPFNITKYCLQQLLGSEQESDHGKAFLACATLGEFRVSVSIVIFVWFPGDLAAWGGLGNEWEERQRELTALGEAMMTMTMMMMGMMMMTMTMMTMMMMSMMIKILYR